MEFANRRGQQRRALTAGMKQRAPTLHTVVLKFTSVNAIDSSGLTMLHKLFSDLKTGNLDAPSSDDLPEAVRGVAVLLVGCTGPIRSLLYTAGICNKSASIPRLGGVASFDSSDDLASHLSTHDSQVHWALLITTTCTSTWEPGTKMSGGKAYRVHAWRLYSQSP
jgi:hypothetical protein